MDDPRSPLSPIDAGADPGPYPMPDSPSLSASTEQDLSEARVRGTSNMVARAPGPNRIIYQNAESGARVKPLSVRSATLDNYELWLFSITEVLFTYNVSHLVDRSFVEPTLEMVASQNTEVGIADLPALLIEYQLSLIHI